MADVEVTSEVLQDTIDMNSIVPEVQQVVADVINIDDIVNDHDILVQRENELKDFLTQSILNVSASSLRPKLIQWASLQYPYGYTLMSAPVVVPQFCSDGVSRTIDKYIEFCLGMTIDSIISSLSQRITGVILTYRLSPSLFEIIVIKA